MIFHIVRYVLFTHCVIYLPAVHIICENLADTIACPDGQIINLLFANFGRQVIEKCKHIRTIILSIT